MPHLEQGSPWPAYPKQSLTPGLRGEASGQVSGFMNKMQVGAGTSGGGTLQSSWDKKPRGASVEYLKSPSKQESPMAKLVGPKLAVVCPR